MHAPDAATKSAGIDMTVPAAGLLFVSRPDTPRLRRRREDGSFEDAGHVSPPFAAKTYADRLRRVRESMIRLDIDMLLCTCPNNIYYLSNYQTPGNPLTALVIRLDAPPHLVTRQLEASNAYFRTRLSYECYGEGEDCVAKLAQSILRHSPRRIGYEGHTSRMTIRQHQVLQDSCAAASWIDASYIVDALRTVKDSTELAYVRRAAQCAARGICAGVRAALPGASETSIAGAINHALMDAGAEYAAYPVFVASGRAGCMAHHAASRKVVQEGELVFFEVGTCINRYHAARMHTIYVGDAPPAWFGRARDAICAAMGAARQCMRPNALASDIDKCMRTPIEAWLRGEPELCGRMADRSGYGIGIGLGTDWSEVAVLAIHSASSDVLAENQTIHLIPWLQLAGVGAVGFSDTIVVTREGGVSLFATDPPTSYELSVRAHRPRDRRDVPGDLAAWASVQESIQLETWASVQEALRFHRDSDPTPLVTERVGSEPLVHMKCEMRRMGQRAFKILGVSYAVDRLARAGKLHTLATMTDGNHGEALSSVARDHGVPCEVFVPRNADPAQIDRIRANGASVHAIDGTYDDAIAELRTQAAAHGWTIVSDTGWPGYESVPTDIMCGYCRIFHEALEQMREPPTHAFIQAGVGGLLAAAIVYLRQASPTTSIVCVEPAEADCIFESAVQESITSSSKTVDSVCQGLNCGTPSSVAWPIIREGVDHYLSIGDEWARRAVARLAARGLVVSESGASGLAGVMAATQRRMPEGPALTEASRVLVVLTEGFTRGDRRNLPG